MVTWSYLLKTRSAERMATAWTCSMRSRMWVATVAGLCALYFVVTGVQFWATEYLTVVLGESLATVIGAFTATSATGPVLGVVFGGWYVDRAGGYKDAEGRATASKCCAMFGAIAVCLAVPAAFVKHFESVIAMVWLVLFWGGAVVPGATGLLLTAVPLPSTLDTSQKDSTRRRERRATTMRKSQA